MKNLLLAFIGCAALAAGAQVSAQAQAFSDSTADAARVIELIDARLAIMPEVAAWKWRAHQPIADGERERQVLERSVADAEAIGIDGASARHFFDVQIRMARAVQSRSFASWQASTTEPPEGRDLNRELRPRLDAIGRELLVAMYLASGSLPTWQDAAANTRLAALKRYSGVADEDIAELRSALLAARMENAPTIEIIKRVGVLRIGMTGDYAPFSIDRKGELRGFDVELALALAQHWGVTAKFVRTTWPTLMDDFQRHRFDVAMSGISVTPERAARADFSTAYHIDGKTPIARCEDARKFTTLDRIDKPEVRVIVNPGGTNERFVREHIKHATVIVHGDNRTVFDELLAGRADVMVTDGIEVALQSHQHPQKLCGTMRTPFTQTPKAIMLPQSTGLSVDVNAWLAPRLATGEIRDRLQRATRAAQ
jgi:cyclohexadienyl dehydratase